MKPKPYRKNKKVKGSDLSYFDNNAGGGPVKFVDGPETSVGQKSGKTISKATVEDGSVAKVTGSNVKM
jgi:hypothetical protein